MTLFFTKGFKLMFYYELLYRCLWHYFDGHYTKIFIHIIYVSTGGQFVVFLEPLSWCMFLYFLRTVQYFLMKFCTDVLSITLPVTTLKLFYIISFSLLETICGYFGANLGVFCGLFWRLSHEILYISSYYYYDFH